MFISQEGKCAICGREEERFARSLHVDHDHKTGQVRGLLCHGCNVGMGSMGDDIGVLQKSIEYLEKFVRKVKEDS